jgi:hypothetical protein
MQHQAVGPAADAERLAEEMVNSSAVMRQIIAETLQSAQNGRIREAGRTHCPESGKVKGPLNRFPRAIDLASCPVDTGGAWHTHVSPEEIRNPTNSLPDMANVMFGLLDVSIVAGTETADVIVAPVDRGYAMDIFQNAIGAEVSTPQELTDEIMSGRINPATARQRARQELSTLVRTKRTGLTDLNEIVSEIPAENWARPLGSGSAEAFSGNAKAPMKAVDTNKFDESGLLAKQALPDTDLTALVFSTAVGTIVGGAVDRLIFKD